MYIREERIKLNKRKVVSYNIELKEQVVKECIETNNYQAVSRKHEIRITTIYGWLAKYKNKAKRVNENREKELEKELKEAKLENEILKELLKKSNQLWLKDMK